MDNTEVHDSRFNNRNNSLVHAVLSGKLNHQSDEKSEGSTISSRPSTCQPRYIIPKYNFVIENYTVGEHVEYDVRMVEWFKVLGRRVQQHYTFKTRYSKLEKLYGRVGGEDFPPKRWFGNHDVNFIKQRIIKLQAYLNVQAQKQHPEFLAFITQIKEINFLAQLKAPFKL